MLDWSNPPFAKWFVGGEVNAAYSALDRHVENGLVDRVAIYFEGEPGDTRTYAYAQLTEEVKKAANAFESLGVVKGDRVAVYLPMIPEAVITLSAGARIGAVPSVVFGGFSADALGPPDRGCRGQARPLQRDASRQTTPLLPDPE